MDVTALPLPWLERLALALEPAEIARLQTVCRLLRDTLDTDRVWRASQHRWLRVPRRRCCAAENAPVLAVLLGLCCV